MYHDFARIYDRFQDIDYSSFISFYKRVFKRYRVAPETVIDLGCGSGNVTIPLAGSGFNVVGVDISPDMLAIASDKAYGNELDIMFVNADMTEFEYPQGADAVISALDCVNYLSSVSEVKKLFASVYKTLSSGGVFVFDINSEYKLREILGNNTFVYEDDEAYCVWDCGYYPEDGVTAFDLNFFLKDKDGKYERFYEYQEEKLYGADELICAAIECGFKAADAYADLTFEEPYDKTERIFFVLQK